MSANILQDAKEALEGLSAARIIEIYSDEFLFEDTSTRECITDRQALNEYFERLFTLPRVNFSEIRVFEADHFAIIEWTWDGVKRSNGEPFRVRGASVIELSGGKVRRESIYYDPMPALA